MKVDIKKLSKEEIKRLIESSNDFEYASHRFIEKRDNELGVNETFLYIKAYDTVSLNEYTFIYDDIGLEDMIKNGERVEHTPTRIMLSSAIAREANRIYASAMYKKFGADYIEKALDCRQIQLDLQNFTIKKLEKQRNKIIKKRKLDTFEKIIKDEDCIEIDAQIDKFGCYYDLFQTLINELKELQNTTERSK